MAVVVTLDTVSYKDANHTKLEGELGFTMASPHLPVYLKDSDGIWYLMDVSSGTGTQESAGLYGVGLTMSQGQSGERVDIVTFGSLVVSATLTPPGSLQSGKQYIAGGAAAGDINEDADANTGNWYKTSLFIARGTVGSNTEIFFNPSASGVQE